MRRDCGEARELGPFRSAELRPAQKETATRRPRQWDGAGWSAAPGFTERFAPLLAYGSSDVWAARGFDTVHYDGKAWSVIKVGSTGHALEMADGLSPNDVWFVDPNWGLHHWDGKELGAVAPFPEPFTAVPPIAHHHLVAANESGVWMVGKGVGDVPTDERVMHFDGNRWNVIALPGIAVAAIARGPDGRVRVLSQMPRPAIYVVDDAGAVEELTPPNGVVLTDVFSTSTDLLAVGVSGATLRLAKAPAAGP